MVCVEFIKEHGSFLAQFVAFMRYKKGDFIRKKIPAMISKARPLSLHCIVYKQTNMSLTLIRKYKKLEQK